MKNLIINLIINFINSVLDQNESEKFKLQNIKYTPLDHENIIKDCSICSLELCSLELKDEIVKTDCGHYYHKLCINTWLNIRNSCPICRSEIEYIGIESIRTFFYLIKNFSLFFIIFVYFTKTKEKFKFKYNKDIYFFVYYYFISTDL